jgi:hypothetical protein
MVVVKISKKQELDGLVSKLTLRLGHKPTQQDVIDECVQLGQEHFEELVGRFAQGPKLDAEKLQKIKELSEALADVPWIEPKREDFPNEDDADIYSA